jgi:hypothetical protein
MAPPPRTDELFAPELQPGLVPIARKVFWWGDPEQWVTDGHRFLAQVMTYGDWDTVRSTMALVGESAFRQVLERPPPGVFDLRSWHYWHLVFKLTPVPPLPQRIL